MTHASNKERLLFWLERKFDFEASRARQIQIIECVGSEPTYARFIGPDGKEHVIDNRGAK